MHVGFGGLGIPRDPRKDVPNGFWDPRKVAPDGFWDPSPKRLPEPNEVVPGLGSHNGSQKDLESQEGHCKRIRIPGTLLQKGKGSLQGCSI